MANLISYSNSIENLARYVTGLLADMPHKTCETIAAVVVGTSTEWPQQRLTNAAWEPQALEEVCGAGSLSRDCQARARA